MTFLNKILGKFLGNKADKDMAEIAPLLELTKKNTNVLNFCRTTN